MHSCFLQAPECYGGVYCDRSDVYALGMIIWEAVTGLRPFGDAVSDVQVQSDVLKNVRPPLTNVPENLRSIISACWHPGVSC